MQTQIEVVTPSLAKAYLESNLGNRQVRRRHVLNLADAIRRGEWKLTHQGISFDVKGVLQDGQHRLMACIEANMPINIQVTRGAPEEARLAMDTGRNRNLADMVNLPRRHCETATFIARFCINDPSPSQSSVFVEKFFKVIDELLIYCPTSRRRLSSSPIRSAAAILLAEGKNSDHIKTQYRALVLMNFDEMSPAVKAFCKWILGADGTSGGELQRLIFIKALYAFDEANSDSTTIAFRNVQARYEDTKARINKILTKGKK